MCCDSGEGFGALALPTILPRDYHPPGFMRWGKDMSQNAS
jgi:hypothetical protein